jgi:hypothetical protein
MAALLMSWAVLLGLGSRHSNGLGPMKTGTMTQRDEYPLLFGRSNRCEPGIMIETHLWGRGYDFWNVTMRRCR